MVKSIIKISFVLKKFSRLQLKFYWQHLLAVSLKINNVYQTKYIHKLMIRDKNRYKSFTVIIFRFIQESNSSMKSLQIQKWKYRLLQKASIVCPSWFKGLRMGSGYKTILDPDILDSEYTELGNYSFFHFIISIHFFNLKIIYPKGFVHQLYWMLLKIVFFSLACNC